MWIAPSRPVVSSVVVVGAGAAILTPIAKFMNGKPGQSTRLRWLDAGAPAITDHVKIQIIYTSSFVPGFFGLFGASIFGAAVTAGLKFSFMGKRVADGDFTYALGGNSALQRAIMRNDNSIVALGIPAAGLDPIHGVEMTIWNDIAGAPAIGTSGFLDLGDFWASAAFDADIDADWKFGYPDNNTAPDSKNVQPDPEVFPPGRILSFARRLLSFNDAFVGTASVPSWERIRTLCCNGQPTVVIPRYGTRTALDVTGMHMTSVFGKMKFGELPRSPGDLFAISATVQEIPALLA